MTISYKLNTTLTGRQAVMLNWNLSKVQGEVRIINKEENRVINAKSLIGLLSGGFKSDNIIDILIENDTNLMEVKKCFNEVGREI